MKTSITRWIIPMGLMFVLTCCEDNDELKDKGKQAAGEYCDCYKENSWDVCLQELRANYEDHNHYVFVDAFDDANTCGMTYIVLRGHEAATEFCDCLEEKTENKCLQELNTNYSSYNFKTEEFVDILTEVNECEYKFVLEKTSASVKSRFVLKKRE
jgi:hypothetical protein